MTGRVGGDDHPHHNACLGEGVDRLAAVAATLCMHDSITCAGISGGDFKSFTSSAQPCVVCLSVFVCTSAAC